MSPHGKMKKYVLWTWMEDGKLRCTIRFLRRAVDSEMLCHEVEAASAYDAKWKARKLRADHERAREATK